MNYKAYEVETDLQELVQMLYNDELDYHGDNLHIEGNDCMLGHKSSTVEQAKENLFDKDMDLTTENIIAELLLMGEEWEHCLMRGYCQGDWNELFYKKDSVNPELIETYYFGKGVEYIVKSENSDDFFSVFVPDCENTLEYLKKQVESGDTIQVFGIDGYTTTPRYKEI